MIDPIEARSLARSIVEARKEGRRLKPITNTKLMTADDALKIQEAVIELRLAAGESLLGWALVDGSHISPIMSSALIDDRSVMGIPSQAVDVRVEPVVVLGAEPRIGLRAMDRLISGGIMEDAIASGHGLVAVAQGDELPSTYVEGFAIKVGRSKREITGAFDAMREDVEKLLQARGRALGRNDLIISAALLPGEALERGQERTVVAVSEKSEARCVLRHL